MFVLVGLLLLALAGAASGEVFGDFTYRLNDDGTAVITGYTGHAEEVIIPWHVNRHRVSEIGEGAFMGNQSMRAVRVPIGVIVVRASAFEGCVALSEVTLREKLETIEDRAFAGCTALTSLFLPDSLNEVGDECFEAWTVLSSNPGAWAAAYSEWTGQAFEVYVPVTPTPRPLTADYRYEVRDGGVYITGYSGDDYDVRVPAEIDGMPVLAIGQNAFYSRYQIASIVLPEGLTLIDRNAFYSCTGLESVTLPSTLVTIGENAFRECESLKAITIPKGVTKIGLRAFQECRQLRRVDIPASVGTISNHTFYGCHDTLTIYAPKGSAAQRFAYNKGYNYEQTSP